MKTTVISLNEDDFYGNEDDCYGMKTNAINLCTKSALPLGFRRCHIFDIVWQCQIWHLCYKSIRYYLWVSAGVTHLALSNNANFCAQCQLCDQTIPNVHAMPFLLLDNAKYANNANNAFRQCQIFTQWHLCKSDNAIYADNANCAKNAISYISLDDCRFGIVWAHNWHNWLIKSRPC